MLVLKCFYLHSLYTSDSINTRGLFSFLIGQHKPQGRVYSPNSHVHSGMTPLQQEILASVVLDVVKVLEVSAGDHRSFEVGFSLVVTWCSRFISDQQRLALVAGRGCSLPGCRHTALSPEGGLGTMSFSLLRHADPGRPSDPCRVCRDICLLAKRRGRNFQSLTLFFSDVSDGPCF